MNVTNMLAFTLLEILLVISLTAILLVMAVPNLRDCYQHLMLNRIVFQLKREFTLARSMAIATGQKTNYCCIESWEKKRVIQDSKGVQINAFPALPKHYQLSLKNSLGHNDCIIFTPLGFTLSQRASFYLNSLNENKRLIVNIAGQLRIEE